MRKLLVAALLALVATGVNAQDKNAEKKSFVIEKMKELNYLNL